MFRYASVNRAVRRAWRPKPHALDDLASCRRSVMTRFGVAAQPQPRRPADDPAVTSSTTDLGLGQRVVSRRRLSLHRDGVQREPSVSAL